MFIGYFNPQPHYDVLPVSEGLNMSWKLRRAAIMTRPRSIPCWLGDTEASGAVSASGRDMVNCRIHAILARINRWPNELFRLERFHESRLANYLSASARPTSEPRK